MDFLNYLLVVTLQIRDDRYARLIRVAWCLLGVNSKRRVQSKWKCESHESMRMCFSPELHWNNTAIPKHRYIFHTKVFESVCGRDQAGFWYQCLIYSPSWPVRWLPPSLSACNAAIRVWRVQELPHTVWRNLRSCFLRTDNFLKWNRKDRNLLLLSCVRSNKILTIPDRLDKELWGRQTGMRGIRR